MIETSAAAYQSLWQLLIREKKARKKKRRSSSLRRFFEFPPGA
jgi:hypothetical protein